MPFGETLINQSSPGSNWSTRYSFSAKEMDEESKYHYFGARYYDSDLSIFLSVDPMASKYPSLTPYAYVANNPIKLVDPNGMEWEKPEDQQKANTLIGSASKQLSFKQNLVAKLEKNKFTSFVFKSTIKEAKEEIGHLEAGISNLKEMGETKDATYHFASGFDEGGVKKRADNVINIEHKNDAMAWHETVHIGDAKANPAEWGWTNDNYLGSSDKYYAKHEIHAYKSQFSFDNSSIKYKNGYSVSKIGGVIDWMKYYGLNKPQK
jgi:RHS repeat-associated protein